MSAYDHLYCFPFASSPSEVSSGHVMSTPSIPPELDRYASALQRAIGIYLECDPSCDPASVKPEDNVVGLAVGRKIVRGQLTSTRCLRFYVIHKAVLAGRFRQFTLPREFEGIPTDVIDVGGPLRALGAPLLCRSRLRPARPGCSIGFELPGAPPDIGSAGTLGAIVRLADGRFGMLSNNHVLANVNQLPVGTTTLQPGIADDGNPKTDRIGQIANLVQIERGKNLDCGVAVVDRENDIDPRFLGTKKLSSGVPIEATEGMRVWKYGRTTRYTAGRVDNPNFAFRMSYDLVQFRDGKAVSTTMHMVFSNQISIIATDGYESNTPFASDGDSGAVIIEEDTSRPTGLLLAGNDRITAANHLSPVLSHLNVEVVI